MALTARLDPGAGAAPLAAMLIAALLAAPAASRARRSDGDVSGPVQSALVSAAEELARCGRPDEVREVVQILRDLDVSLAEIGELEDDVAARLARATKRRDRVPNAVRFLSRAVDELALDIAALEDAEAREHLGRAALALDPERVDVRELLDHRRVDGRWLSRRELAREERRAALAAHFAAARDLDVPLEVTNARHPVQELDGAVSVRVVWRDVELFAPVPAERAAAIVREAVRGLALLRAALLGELRPPRTGRHALVLLSDADAFERALGSMERVDEAAARVAGLAPDERGWTVVAPDDDAMLSARLFLALAGSADLGDPRLSELRYVEASLFDGLTGWIAASCFGVRVPRVGPDATEEAAEGDGELRDPARARDELEALARTFEDPALGLVLRTAADGLSGAARSKAECLAQFLAEEGELLRVVRDTLPHRALRAGKKPREMFVEAVGGDLGAFEADLRAWLLPRDAGLIARLGR
jgi:hypothetical protein